jgi:Peptidase family C25
MKRAVLFLAAAFCAVMLSATAQGQTQQGTGTVPVTGFLPTTENFNTLAATPENGTSTLDTAPLTGPVGWYALETDTSQNATYGIDEGSQATGDTYSYGTTASTDRALGTLLSGTLVSTIGAQFTNNTGSPIGSVTISYRGEEWRLGTAGRTDQLDFQYSTNATSLSTGTWLNADPLDFTTPNTTTTGAKDGNAAGNFTNIGPVNILFAAPIPNGGTFWIRWVDLNASGSDDGLAVDEFSLTPAAPTAVKLTSFTAVYTNGSVLLNWKSGYEVENLGYHVYRVENGKRTRLTPSMVAGSALLAGARTVLSAGQSYTWFDRMPAGGGGVSYYLEDVDLNGKRTLRGPITPVKGNLDRQQSAQAAMLDQISTDARSGQQEWPTASAEQQAHTARATQVSAETLTSQQSVAGQKGVKIRVRHSGWVRVTQPQLVAAGLSQSVNPACLQLFVNSRQVPIKVSANSAPGQFTANDWIEFYALKLDTPTTDLRTYYLVSGTKTGFRIRRSPYTATPDETQTGPQSFNYTVERKERSIFFSGLDNGDAENFFGQVITKTAITSPLNVQHLDANVRSARLRVTLQGVTAGRHQVQVQVNGTNVGRMNFNGRAHPTSVFTINTSLLREGENSVRMVALGGETDISLVDTLMLTYARRYRAVNNRLQFSVSTTAPVSIEGFAGSNVRILDITNPNGAQEVVPTVDLHNGAYRARVQMTNAEPGAVKTLLAFTDDEVDSAASVTKNEPSTLASITNRADFLIITERNLLDSVQPLADLRTSQGMQVKVVDVEDIYDEFSYGAHGPQAIRDFIRRAAQSWQLAPRYVLLVGDATYDPRNYLGHGNNDLVPTKMLYAGTMETASDDWLADFNNDAIPELAMGRLPLRTTSEAATIIGKITNFSPQSAGQGALLVADRNDENDFETASQSVQSLLPAGTQAQVINRGNQATNTVRSQIINGINQGPLVVNYFGHGSVGLWTGAGLLNTSDAAALTNGARLPLFTMMTCLNGFFHDLNGESLSEALLKAPQGGAIAVWASTGLTEMNGQAQIDRQFYETIFAAQAVPLGDAMRAAKAATQDQGVRRTWVLFGDPTMRLR